MSFMTAAQARLYIPSMTGSGSDTDLDALIGRLHRVFAWYLGFQPATAGANPVITATNYTQYMTANGGVELRLPYLPVQSIGSIYDDADRVYGASTLVASGDYDLHGDTGLVILKSTASHGEWSSAHRAIKVTFNAGFSSVPGAIVHAGGIQMAHIWAGRNYVGKKNVSQGGASMTVADLQLLPEVKESLAPYRMPSAFIG